MDPQLAMPRSASYAQSMYSISGPSRRAPPQINRLQLAAALLEYDNEQDEEDGYDGKDHRESAIFRQFKQQALDSTVTGHAGQEEGPVPPMERRRRDSRMSLAADAVGGSQQRREKVTQPYEEDEEPGPAYANSYVGDGTEAGMAGVGALAAHGPSHPVDIGSWELPSHLVHDSPAKPRHVSHPASAQRPPNLTLDTALEQPDQPALPTWRGPNVGEIVPPSSMYSRSPIASTTLPPLSTVRSNLASPVTSHFPRAQSAHLDSQYMASLAEEQENLRPNSRDEVIETLVRAVRTRQIVEDTLGLKDPPSRPGSLVSSYTVPLNDGDGQTTQRRMRTLSSMSVNPTTIPLPLSPGQHIRTLSSMSYASTYEPALIPIPASPPTSERRVRTISGVSFATDTRPSAEELEDEDQGPNPFAIPAPPEGYASRFDPKAQAEHRRKSLASLDTGSTRSTALRPDVDNRNKMAVPFPVASRNVGKLAQVRAVSMFELTPGNASTDAAPIPTIRLPDRSFPDIPTPDEYAKPLRPSPYGRRAAPDRTSLLRPRTLVMPSLLEGATPPRPKPKGFVPDGWELGDKPLPKEARTSILMPFPEADNEEGGDLGVLGPTTAGQADGRRPGKLYGTNLMDQLEMRKAAMKGKQRVFTGDSRPAMFTRSATTQDLARTSMLPSSLTLPILPSTSDDLDEQDGPQHIDLPPGGPRRPSRLTKSVSMFGVDQVWERDVEKIRSIQEREAQAKDAAEAKERAKEQEQEERRKRKEKGKEKIRGKPLDEANVYFAKDRADLDNSAKEEEGQGNLGQRLSLDPPRLDFMPLKGSTSGSDLMPAVTRPEGVRQRQPSNARIPQSAAWDSDEDEWEQIGTVRRRKGGGGLPPSMAGPEQLGSTQRAEGEDSDEEPLSVALTRAQVRSNTLDTLGGGTSKLGQNVLPAQPVADDEEEDEVPISHLMRVKIEELRTGQPSRKVTTQEEDEEDDVPLSRLAGVSGPRRFMGAPTLGLQTNLGHGEGSLGLWPSTLSPAPITPAAGEDDDDDVPLGAQTQAAAAAVLAEEGEEDDDDVPLGAPQKSTLSPVTTSGINANQDGWQHYMAMEYARQAGEAVMWQAQQQHAQAQAQVQAQIQQAEWARQSAYMSMGMDMGAPPAPWVSRVASGSFYDAQDSGNMGLLSGYHGYDASRQAMTGQASMPSPGPNSGPAGNIDTWRQQVALPRSRPSSSVGGGVR